MNGARAEPVVSIIKKLISKSISMMGIIQYFFLDRKNSQNSFKVSIDSNYNFLSKFSASVLVGFVCKNSSSSFLALES